jgi:hypothetical protein
MNRQDEVWFDFVRLFQVPIDKLTVDECKGQKAADASCPHWLLAVLALTPLEAVPEDACPRARIRQGFFDRAFSLHIATPVQHRSGRFSTICRFAIVTMAVEFN